jgi:hypothetical protein
VCDACIFENEHCVVVVGSLYHNHEYAHGSCLSAALRFPAVPQIAVPLVERMPNSPTPFSPPDWKQKAADYTANVFDATSKVCRGSFSIIHPAF